MNKCEFVEMFNNVGNNKYTVPAWGLSKWNDMKSFIDIVHKMVRLQYPHIDRKDVSELINDYVDWCIMGEYPARIKANEYIVECKTPVVLYVFEKYQLEITYEVSGFGYGLRFARAV